ncbi:hypothetical protein Bca4012_083755 [Brassica carinata]
MYFRKTYGFPRIDVRVLRDQSIKPFQTSGYKGESAGTTSSHMTYFDTPSYTTKNQPPCLNKGLVKRMERTIVFTRLLSPAELLHPTVRERPQTTKQKEKKNISRRILLPQDVCPSEDHFSSQYSIIRGISKDILTEVNQQFACLARPYAIRILQTRGYMPPGPYAKKTDPAYLRNVNPRSRIQASDQGSKSPTADSHSYN